jgi:hypothetical protein
MKHMKQLNEILVENYQIIEYFLFDSDHWL